ncbi:GNAT family N-acetyltransferase [Butyrivibrio sp. XBB1001]|uniref:GNAT family N-acetyltransferase n=1 Tax=Butyrivibrio sp. XBB1001 TaxID=1280682 RepID=UPI000423CD24|nr:GNAT family N-acetyltransferase [Butyrivibrio sp. XBB1001]
MPEVYDGGSAKDKDIVERKDMIEEIKLVEADNKYADEITAYRQEFLDCGDHMDGCGSLRKDENVLVYIENCKKRAAKDAPAEIGGHAQQFLCVRNADDHLLGMIQYRYDADPKFQIGYSVRPCDRGNGYAKWMLRQLLSWLGNQGKTEATIACEPSNLASEHVILSCGGKLIETCNYKGIALKVWNISLT